MVLDRPFYQRQCILHFVFLYNYLIVNRRVVFFLVFACHFKYFLYNIVDNYPREITRTDEVKLFNFNNCALITVHYDSVVVK